MTKPGHHGKPANKTEQDKDRERASGPTPLRQAIHARINRPHKGDVGRAETNEEIFQGSTMKELPENSRPEPTAGYEARGTASPGERNGYGIAGFAQGAPYNERVIRNTKMA